MKKMLMTMALCGLAMAGSAQKNMSQMSAKGQDPRGGVTRTRVQQVKLVGEVSSTMIANNEIVKFDVDDIVYKSPGTRASSRTSRRPPNSASKARARPSTSWPRTDGK